MIDVNSFKAINDTLGHHKGDEILCHLANLLTSIFPKDHYEIFRIGGDEFAIIGSGAEEYDVDGRISAINVSVEASRMGYSVAAGRSTVIYGENQAFENAFIRADEAMYEAKRIIKEKQAKKILDFYNQMS
jgi:diguanylate cyclase (GGDEF)-like protein